MAKLTRRDFFGVIGMSRKLLIVVLLLLTGTGCQQGGSRVDGPARDVNNTVIQIEPAEQLEVVEEAAAQTEIPALQVGDTTGQTEPDTQLKINREALLRGSNEQIRIDAATVMLLSDEPPARRILLEILGQPENSAARAAVCKALSQTRAINGPVNGIKNKDDFIQPLFDILTTEQDSVQVRSAAEATLIFEYEQILKPLEELITGTSLPVQARLNGIYTLKLQPDIEAIVRLMELLDDPDKQVAAEAEKTVLSLGIPVGKDAESRRQNIYELKRKGKDEFFRDLRIRQEEKMRRLEAESDFWQNQYLGAMDKIYNGLGEDTVKGRFLIELLGSPKAVVRLWTLEKVSQWRVGTTSKMPVELGPVLVSLVSDPDRAVRLKTAKLLSLMGQLNSSRPLLQQLEIEQDDEVKMEFFVALGEACHYAFSPNAEFKIPEEIRKKTLEWAEKYLSEQEPKKVQKGAEVIKKLLEQGGLTSADVDKYLGLLVEKYNQQKNRPDSGPLQGELLGAMAGLCAQSVYKAESAKRFAPLFEEALNDKTDLVREAAVDGLIYTDKAAALKQFRKVLVNDTNVIIRKKLIGLAGEVGTQEDLTWLAEKVGTATENETVWQAILEVFRRSDFDVLGEWLTRFGSQDTQIRLTDEQMLSFLEIVERKVVSEGKAEVIKDVRSKLAQLYTKSGKFEKAAEYLGMLREAAVTPEEKEAILASLLDVYLRWPNMGLAIRLIDNCLLEKDLEPNNIVVRSIDDYLSRPPVGADPNVLLKALVRKVPQERPLWQEQLKRWLNRRPGRVDSPDKPVGTAD